MLAEKVKVLHVTLFCLLKGDGGGWHCGFKTQAKEHNLTRWVFLRQLQRIHR